MRKVFAITLWLFLSSVFTISYTPPANNLPPIVELPDAVAGLLIDRVTRVPAQQFTAIITNNTGAFDIEDCADVDTDCYTGQLTANIRESTPTNTYKHHLGTCANMFHVTNASASENWTGITRYSGLDNIPTTAVVQSVTMAFYVFSNNPNTPPNTIWGNRLLKSWDDSVQSCNTPGWVNWNQNVNGVNWDTPGAIGAGDIRSTLAFDANEVVGSTDSWINLNCTPTTGYVELCNDVQYWINNPSENYGMLLRPNPTGVNSNLLRSSGFGTDGLRPYLKVVYTN